MTTTNKRLLLRLSAWVFPFALGLLSGCSLSTTDSSSGSAPSLAPEGVETSYNGTSIGYSGSTLSITAHAQFTRWDDYTPSSEKTVSCLTSAPCYQGLVRTSTHDIVYAEAQIYNVDTGALVQAGETDGSGLISMVLPKAAGNYRLEVHSRADNSHYSASVLNNPFAKSFYSIKNNFSLTGNESGTVPVNLTPAPYNGTLEGGAFNILNDIFLANEFLRRHATGASTAGQPDYCPVSVCPAVFTVAPKIQVYWTKGLSPGTYYSSPSTGISFFAPNSGGGVYRGLYILGGIEGEICADTDHFDNSVIIHEYGHFLENAFGKSDSPGGSHDGNRVIDPRLAWSEGWADFFQSAVLGRSFYRDTQKNAECAASGTVGATFTARLSFPDFNLETMKTNQDSVSSSSLGEGNFREMSVARQLWDSMTGTSQLPPYDGNNGQDGYSQDPSDGTSANLGFAVIWQAFKGLSDSSLHGRCVAEVNSNIYSELTAMGGGYLGQWNDETYADPSKPLVREKQRHDTRDYGMRLTPRAVAHGSCTSSTSPLPDWTFTSSAPVMDDNGMWSDLFNTNDMYLYYYDGSAAHSVVKLHYKKAVSDASGITDPWDLDLYVYKTDYVFLNRSDIVLKSENNYPEGTNPSYLGQETVDFTGQPAGFYFINVKVFFTSAGQPTRKAGAQYYLETGNGDQLCPP